MPFPTGLLRFARVAAPAAILAAACIAQASTPSKAVSNSFGNTVLSVYPDGRSQKIWMQPDGTWTGASRRGHPLAGKWSVTGDRVCLKQTQPAMPLSYCNNFPADADVGAAWDAKDMLGTPIQVKIVKGVVEVPPSAN